MKKPTFFDSRNRYHGYEAMNENVPVRDESRSANTELELMRLKRYKTTLEKEIAVLRNKNNYLTKTDTRTNRCTGISSILMDTGVALRPVFTNVRGVFRDLADMNQIVRKEKELASCREEIARYTIDQPASPAVNKY